MNYLIYPFKKMAITQRYDETFSHGGNYNGNPRDYSIDDNGGSTAKDSYFYCPCDKMTIKKIYGVGTSSTNTVWLESNDVVKTPTFEDYVTILLMHTEDEDLKNIQVGQVYSRGEQILLEGKDGYATGNHFHMSIGKGKFNNNGWLRNTMGAWVIDSTNGAVKPEDSMYIDKNFTTIINSRNLIFQELPEETIYPKEGIVVADYLNVRQGPGTDYEVSDVLSRNSKVTITQEKNLWYEIAENKWVSKYYISLEDKEENTGYVMATNLNVRDEPSLDGNIINMLPEFTKVLIKEEKNNWCNIGDNQWVSKDYIVNNKPGKYYNYKEVTANYLNVRKTPNGEKLSLYAPLKKGTIVAELEVDNGWTKIGNNRYVYAYYLK